MDSDQKSRIIYNNLAYFGLDLDAIYKKSAAKFSEIITTKFPKKNEIHIICGLGGNGLDGLYIAQELFKAGRAVSIYIPDRVSHSDSELFQNKFQELSKKITIKQDVYAKDIPQADLIIEALIGTGMSGEKVYKRTADIIKRVSHFECSIIAIDKPMQGYNPDLTISINYPKTQKAVAIENVYPEALINSIGPGELLEIRKPYTKSHKNKSGKLLLISFSPDNTSERKLVALSKHYQTEVEVVTIETLFTDYRKDEYKEKLAGVDVVVIDNFKQADNLISNVVYSFLDLLGEAKVINLNSEIHFQENSIEVLASPRNISGSTAFVKLVKSYSSYFLFEDGDKKIDAEGVLVEDQNVENLILLAAIFATSNDLKLSVLAAAFVVVHFRKNKLDIEKDLSKFFQEIF